MKTFHLYITYSTFLACVLATAFPQLAHQASSVPRQCTQASFNAQVDNSLC